MVYGKQYKILKNFNEYKGETVFEDRLMKLCKEEKAILFIEGNEIEFKK